jgi:hypothetical protein
MPDTHEAVAGSLAVPYAFPNHEFHDLGRDISTVAAAHTGRRNLEYLWRDVIGLSDLIANLAAVRYGLDVGHYPSFDVFSLVSMFYHALAQIRREGVRLSDGCIPDADHDSLALIELPLNQPLVANVERLPATWEQNGPRLLEEGGQTVYEIVDGLALITARFQ